MVYDKRELLKIKTTGLSSFRGFRALAWEINWIYTMNYIARVITGITVLKMSISAAPSAAGRQFSKTCYHARFSSNLQNQD